MVFFNCNACGESLKKNQVEKHCFRCRSCKVLACVDCGKDFWGDEYKTHIKCMTEDEKYGGKNYKAKPGANKGERKQEEWTTQVQEAIRKCSNPKLKNMLAKLEDYPNIPRKKAKFENFLKNSVRVPAHFVSQMWDAISAELSKPEAVAENGKSSLSNDGQSADSNTETNAEEKEEAKKLSKRERKEERKKVKHKAEKKDKKNEDEEKVPKKRKRKREEDVEEPANDGETNQDPVPKKKKKKSKSKSEEEPVSQEGEDEDESQQSQANESITDEAPKVKVKFNWETVIVAVLRKREDHEISVKKLRKKVLAEYLSSNTDTYNEDKLLSKFNKKITKNPRFRVLKDKVKLIS